MAGREFVRSWEVLVALTTAELRETRDFTIAGFVKWVLEPLSYMFVYFVVVAAILDQPRFAYPLFLLCALVPWRYFTGVVQESMFLMNRYAETIKNRAFPNEVLPLVLMAAEGTTFLVALTLFVPLMAMYGIVPGLSLITLPLIIVVLAVVTAGPTYLATVFGLYFPDFRGAAQNLIRAGFFVSNGLIPIDEVPGDQLPLLLKANPFSSVFNAFRAIFLRGRMPRWFDIAYPLAVGLAAFGIGFVLYRRRRFEFPKEV